MSKTFIIHYVQAMLWSSIDDKENPLEDNYSIDDLAPETMERIKKDCESFLNRAESLIPNLLDDYDIPSIAHDFWLTRCGHGTGFWDGDYKDPAVTNLTELAKEFGNLDPYVGYNELIYLG